jgi:tetratricopeptide (TPR) repeat protein
VAGVLALVALVYLPTLGYGFVYDDGWTILSNGFLRVPDPSLLLSPDAAARHVPDAFRPTLVLFDVLAYQLLGELARAHHALSLVLHLLVCALLYAWLGRLQAPFTLRVGAMALFGLLAIHAEAVTVVSFREDLLAAALGLGALVLASRALDDGGLARRVPSAAGAAILMALAAGAKLSAAMLPGLWFLAELTSPWRPTESQRSLRAMLAIAASMQAAAALTLLQNLRVYGSWTPYDPAANPRVLASRIGTSPVLARSAQIHAEYLRQMLLPFGLSPEYTDRGATWTEPATLIACAVLVGSLGMGVWGWRRRRRVLALACLGAFWLALPTSNLFGLPNMQADRFMYMPSIAVCIGLAALALALGRALVPRFGSAAALAPVVGFAVLQGAMAQASTSVYGSNVTLWRVAVSRAPDSARAQAMVGLTLLVQGRERELPDADVLTQVGDHCAQALELDPRYELAHLCFARLATARRDWVTAYEHHTRAVELSPDRNDRSLAALAQLSLDLPGFDDRQRRAAALGHVARGLREYPYSPELRVAAGRIAHRIGEPWLALHLYRGARRLRPERWETVLAGVELALDLGHAAAARRTWLQADDLLQGADPAARNAIATRLVDANRLYPTPLIRSLLDPGVFPDDP